MGWDFFSPARSPVVIGTALPSGPVDGQQFILADSATAPTYQWLLQYVAAKSSNKWVFLGGRSAYSEVTTTESITIGSSTYLALATAGPLVAIPVAGDYFVEHGCRSLIVGGTSTGIMSYDIGGTGAVDADFVKGNNVSLMRGRLKTGLTAVTLTAKYKIAAGGGSEQNSFSERWMRVTPVAIGG